MNRFFVILGILLLTLSFAACSKAPAPNISIENARMRLPAPGQTTAAGFFDIVNAGGADVLLSASSPVSGHIELHTHLHENGIMKMRKVDTIEALADQTTQFKPRSLHLMIFNVEIPDGTKTVPVTLIFSKSGAVTLDMKVGMGTVNHDAMDHSKMKH